MERLFGAEHLAIPTRLEAKAQERFEHFLGGLFHEIPAKHPGLREFAGLTVKQLINHPKVRPEHLRELLKIGHRVAGGKVAVPGASASLERLPLYKGEERRKKQPQVRRGLMIQYAAVLASLLRFHRLPEHPAPKHAKFTYLQALRSIHNVARREHVPGRTHFVHAAEVLTVLAKEITTTRRFRR